MKRLAQALLGLGKAILARPKKATQAPTQIHWTKADKPLEEMTPEERKNFAEKMAAESLKSLENKPNTYVKTSSIKPTSLIIVLLSLTIFLLLYFNWSKVPRYGSNAKALSFARVACIDSDKITPAFKLSSRVIAAEKAFSLDPSWERLANAYRDIYSTSELLKQMTANGMEYSTEYTSQYSSLQRALVTANGICNGINLK